MNFSIRNFSYLLALVLALGTFCYTDAFQDGSPLPVASSDVRVLDSDLDDNLDMLKLAVGVFVYFALDCTLPAVYIRSGFVSLSVLPETRAPPFIA